MLKKRVITGLCCIAILVPLVWFDKPLPWSLPWSLPWFTILVAIWGLLGASEFYKLVAASTVLPLTRFGLTWTVLFILSGNAGLLSLIEPYFNLNLLTPLLITSAVMLPFVWLLRREQKEKIFTSWAWTIAGILYIGWLYSYTVALRGIDNTQTALLDEGRNWVYLTMFATFASDSAAYFVGTTLGKHHLAPRISPAKTWEGAIGGVFGAIIVSLLFTLHTPLGLSLSWEQAILLGLLVSIFGQFGDLVKSLFKRTMGVKDSGKLLPGHGGVLDRTDSIAFAGVVVYYYVIWTIH